jgi:hypothetical protein
LINGFSFGKPVWYLSMDTSSSLGPQSSTIPWLLCRRHSI